MLSIAVVLTGDLQEAQMVKRYLSENYKAKAYERILVYCGKDEAALQYLDEDADFLLLDGRSAGVAASCNAALFHAQGDAILFLSAPYIVLEPALHAMQRALEANPKALVLPTLQDALGVDRTQNLPATLKADYQDLQGFLNFTTELSHERGTSFILSSLDFCFLARREALLFVGGFLEKIHTTLFLMLDLCLRFWKAEHTCILAHGAFVHLNEVAIAYDKDDKAMFAREHGMKYPYSFMPRLDMLQYVDLKKPSLKVLEVGCACGATLLAIYNQNPQAKLYGIEFNEQAAALASHFATIEALDVEKLQKPEWREMFDYIILGDVIEHLKEPWQAMKNLASLVKPGGYVIVSVPNVMHISVFSMMLAGRWQYEDQGILDHTHLRFFTKKEILLLLKEAGFEMESMLKMMMPTTPQDEELIKKLKELLPAQSDPDELDAYQWVVLAQKRG